MNWIIAIDIGLVIIILLIGVYYNTRIDNNETSLLDLECLDK